MECIFILFIASVLGLSVGVGLAYFLCAFETEIKIWLWSHNYCLRSIKLPTIDNKTYDAFVVSAEGDAEFIKNQMIPKLEKCENPYRLCLPDRDWNGVELLEKAIPNSVTDSYMTIIVLSNKLIETKYPNWQVRGTANRCRSPMIVILLDTLDDMQNHIDVQKYLSLSTCTLKYNDCRFWEKLRIAISNVMPTNEKQLENYI